MTPVSLVLELSGAIAALIGAWRSYMAARAAMAPLEHQGDPTRSAIEATRPFPMRPRVRLFARRASIAVGWLIVAMYGLYLLATGMGASS